AAINQHRHFCVNVLLADQMAIAERFAGRGGLKGSARYEGASWSALATGALALEDSLAAVDCTSRTRLCATATRSSSGAPGMWSAECGAGSDRSSLPLTDRLERAVRQ
ncbi:MAG: hypothetical protein E5W45_02130, partial [Mesorhizobium sp.]